MEWECYICHKPIKRHEYTRHVGSHLAADDTGMHPQPDPSLTTFSFDTVNHDHHGTTFPAHSTPPRLRASTSSEHGHPQRPATSDDELQSSDLEDVLAQLPTDSRHRTNIPPSRFPARTAPVLDRPQQTAQEGKFAQSNAFQIWLKNPADNSPKYTTIDGQKSKPDFRAQFRQAAKVLRRTTKEEVIKIVNEFEGLSCNDKRTCLELVQRVPIFPGLVAYTYTHLIACPRRGWLYKDEWSDRVSELKQSVERWARSGDIQCVLGYSSIKRELLGVLRATRVPSEQHKCNSMLLNEMMVINDDILNLAALVALCITGPQERDILDQCGAQAEELIELFHGLLEANIELEEEYRRCFFNPLIQFSKGFGYCPRGVYLKEGINGLVSEGQGGFGIVYKGKIGSRLVAVKALKRDGQSLPEYNKQVSKEAIVWRHLRHPNCLPLYGIYRMPTEGPNIVFSLVSPWMDKGTLFKYLECNPRANRTQLILDVVRGLNYLHSMQPHVAHRDIKPDNILITSKGRACLADFGLTSAFDTDDRFRTSPSQIVTCGTCNYMAPEIFDAETKETKCKVNKRACDMYALGCTIYAAYTGRHPFHGMRPVLLRVEVMSKRRPGFPEGKISPEMWSFVENLWGHDPLKRLTAARALNWMETKAHQEGVDLNLAPLEEEWEWKGPQDDNCLWSVSF